ncbi:MAG: carboxymuconolactone decarboxylase family protein [Parvibaculum sp.]|uniref:carboxymuconolactone decarboxylase family protein n=1 Tax=Parvibaculum sp. TaxID=2024848 RepID=UPI003C77FEE6
MPNDNRHSRGLAARRQVFDPAYLDRIAVEQDAFDEPFRDFTIGTVWGGTWSGETLSKHQLILVTLAVLAAQGRDEEFEMHLRNAVERVRVTPTELRELLMHLTFYCGAPTGAACFRIAKKCLKELGITADNLSVSDGR